MSSIRTNNPAFSGTIFGDWAVADSRANVMTVGGTAGKALALLTIVIACAAVSWTQFDSGGIGPGVLIGSAIGGLIAFIVTIFNKRAAGFTAPIFCACQGVFLGVLSNVYNGTYHGIVPQAIGLTFAVAALMLVVYATGLIKVTGRFVACFMTAFFALFSLYLTAFLMSLFGMPAVGQAVFGNGLLGLGIGIVAVGLASFKLLLDFDFIERGAEYEAPKYMEWYGAFALMVTLIWLYTEILNLLARLQDRR